MAHQFWTPTEMWNTNKSKYPDIRKSLGLRKRGNVQTALRELKGDSQPRTNQSCWFISSYTPFRSLNLSQHLCWAPQGWRFPYISGMMKTEMSSPEPRRSLVILQPRSLSTPRALITRSCAAIVYLDNRRISDCDNNWTMGNILLCERQGHPLLGVSISS